jgi:DNA-directed RNA polymerase specialized sigma subunit
MPGLQLESDFEAPYQAWRLQPSPANSSALLQSVQPVLDTALRTYGGGLPNLKSKAKQLALDAFQTYDPSRGKLKTHLLTNLQRLQREAMQARQIIQVPERVTLDRMKLQGAETDFLEQFGRDPSDVELADFAGLSLKRIKHVRRAARPLLEGQITREDDEDDGTFAPAAVALHRDYRPLLQFVYDDLGPRDQFLLERLAGLHGHRKHAPGELARLLKISPAAVSQRISGIQQQIDRLMQLEGSS